MSKPVIASAPGKLVLVGEYAVVYGAAALVAAVPRRAVVTLTPGTGSAWQVSTPGFRSQMCHFEHHQMPQLARQLPLLANVLAALDYRGPGCTAELDTREFFSSDGVDGGAKLGLGSSAALCTALLAAVAEIQALRPGESSKGVDLAAALAAHQRLQGGRGSGIDVAASFLGGVLKFQRSADSEPGFTHQTVPMPLPMLWVWSGQAATTTTRLETLERFKKAQPKAFAEVFRQLSELSECASSAAASQTPEAFLQATSEFTQRLANLDQQIGLGVWTQPHHHLAGIAQRCGVLYKTSGAGGGDCGLAMAEDPQKLENFRKNAAIQGFLCWNLDSENQGLKVQSRVYGKKCPVLR